MLLVMVYNVWFSKYKKTVFFKQVVAIVTIYGIDFFIKCMLKCKQPPQGMSLGIWKLFWVQSLKFRRTKTAWIMLKMRTHLWTENAQDCCSHFHHLLIMVSCCPYVFLLPYIKRPSKYTEDFFLFRPKKAVFNCISLPDYSKNKIICGIHIYWGFQDNESDNTE